MAHGALGRVGSLVLRRGGEGQRSFFSSLVKGEDAVRAALACKSWSHLQDLGTGRPTIAVAMSGGVDSSVAAHVLKEQGCEVFGLHMRTWDEVEEGESECGAREDREAAMAACDHLRIPFVEVDLVAEYWNSVFQPYLDKFQEGLTPNPDLSCNRHVKFGVLLDRARSLGADGLATGHFARLRARTDGSGVDLLRGRDSRKDQTYFLSRVSQRQLAGAVFPVGGLAKEEVRALAQGAGLPNFAKKSSSGICFVGKRKFSKFLSQYIDPTPGNFVCAETGQDLGEHDGIELYTRGQRSRIETGGRGAFYVVGKDSETGAVYVAEGRDHPAQLCRGAFVKDLHWIGPGAPSWGEDDVACTFKARYLEEDGNCVLVAGGFGGGGGAKGWEDQPTRFYGADGAREGFRYVRFAQPHAAVTPEQALVLYEGEVCLGSALIHRPGLSLLERP